MPRNQTDKSANAWQDPTGTGDALSELLPIIRKEGLIRTWMSSGSDPGGEMFVLLADGLPEPDRAALKASSDVVLHNPDDLLKKLADLEEENRNLRSLSLTDDLTGLYNYRFFAKQLDIEMSRTLRTGQSVSLMMIDLDDFKQINDTFGHDAGNNYLIQVSETLSQRLRPTDIMCRYGGDEFAVIMPATDLPDAVRIAERLNAAVSRMPGDPDKRSSVSIGVAQYHPDQGGEVEISRFVALADKALYRAKERGKDAICYEGQLPDLNRKTSVSSDERTALLGPRNDE